MGRKFVKAYVVGSSALHAWRRNQAGAATLEREVASPLADCPTTPQELEAIGLSRFDLGTAPIRLMVPSYAHRISKRLYKYRVHSRGLPKGAFRQLGDRVCLASPELCLIQSACVLSRYQLMELCMELCGTYALGVRTFSWTAQTAYPSFLLYSSGLSQPSERLRRPSQ